MPVQYSKQQAILSGICTVEEAEPLLAWLIAHPKGGVSIKEADHLHMAVLQALLALRPRITAPAEDAFFARYVMPCLMPEEYLP
ncbi:MAG: hypothetical protein ACRCU9_12190 [Iodobacter sp.]